MAKPSAIIVIKKFSRSPEKMFRAFDVQHLVKLTFICDLPQESINLIEIVTLNICFLSALDSASDLNLSILTNRMNW